MALITVTGYPCSGKSTRVNQLKAYLEKKINGQSYNGPLQKVLVLSDDSLNIHRSAYEDSQTEKSARASLLSATQRCLAPDAIVILDGMNYIKSFRYQLYCAAREAKLRSCTFYVATLQDLCYSWNTQLLSYSPETLRNLIFRFEEPSSMVRWDSPLLTVMWSDDHVPCEEVWDAITKGNLKPPNAATIPVAKAPANALHALESTTTNIISAIMALQNTSGSVMGGTSKLTVTGTLHASIRLPQRNITITELQRAKRQFVVLHKKAIVLGSTEKGSMEWSEEKIAEKFINYLEEHVQ